MFCEKNDNFVDPNFNALLIHVYDLFVCSWIRVFYKSIVLYISVVTVKFNCDCYLSSRQTYVSPLLSEIKGNNKITELRTILQRESQNS
jgi:hypothetical protein